MNEPTDFFYEPEVTREFVTALLTPPFGNVIDVGANLGHYTVLAAKLLFGTGHHVWAFEPQFSLIPQLMQNLQENGICNVTVMQMALSDHNGIVNFQLPMLGEEVYGGFYQNGRFEALETVQVAARRLDDVLTVHSINDVKLIKLDAEGAELSILRGASRLLATHPVLIFEANEKNLKPFGYTVRDVIDFVSGYGYSLRQLDEENWIAE